MCRPSAEENSSGKLCDKLSKIWAFSKSHDLGLTTSLDILVHNAGKFVFYSKFEVIEIVYWGSNTAPSYDIFSYLY